MNAMKAVRLAAAVALSAMALPVFGVVGIAEREGFVLGQMLGDRESGIYSFYTGMISRGVPHGQGVMDYPDGSRWDGAWRNGLFTGGRVTYPDGRSEELPRLDHQQEPAQGVIPAEPEIKPPSQSVDGK